MHAQLLIHHSQTQITAETILGVVAAAAAAVVEMAETATA
jgi:hypothetical protein